MQCPSCGAPRSDMTVDCVECAAINANQKPTTSKLQSSNGKPKANRANKPKRRGLPAKEFAVKNSAPKGSPVFETMTEASEISETPVIQITEIEVETVQPVMLQEVPAETPEIKEVAKKPPLMEVPPQTSRLIEFPGTVRNTVPEWRKELSERVREVQERRAQEAAIEAEEAERQRNVATSTSNQIELLAQAGTKQLNPLVANALRRIERAHSLSGSDSGESAGVAVAVARAPEESFRHRASQKLERARASRAVAQTKENGKEASTKTEKTHRLAVVSSLVPDQGDLTQKRSRLIADDASNPALNYLDAVSTAPTVDRMPYQRAPIYRRVLSAIVDLLVTLLLTSPVIAFSNVRELSWENARVIAIATACFFLVSFLYLTVAYALTGRTLGMKIFALRAVDAGTGLIPTGGQAASRALVYVLSVPVGVGFLYALFNPERSTLHDHVSRTAVVAT